MSALPNAAKRAEAAIQYFEDRGREVVGVTINGNEFKLDFAKAEKVVVNDADLVNMGR